MAKDLSASGKDAMKIRVNLTPQKEGDPTKAMIEVVKNFFEVPYTERSAFLDKKFGPKGWKSAASIPKKTPDLVM